MNDTAAVEAVKRTAREFATALAETPAFRAFERATEGLRKDEAAQTAMRAYQRKQQSLRVALLLNEASPEQRAGLEILHRMFTGYASVQEQTKAQAELGVLCRSLGDALSQSVGLDYASACGASCCG